MASLSWSGAVGVIGVVVAGVSSVIFWHHRELRYLAGVYAAMAISSLLSVLSGASRDQQVRLALARAAFGAGLVAVILIGRHLLRRRSR
jgi:hypothetical protein